MQSEPPWTIRCGALGSEHQYHSAKEPRISSANSQDDPQLRTIGSEFGTTPTTWHSGAPSASPPLRWSRARRPSPHPQKNGFLASAGSASGLVAWTWYAQHRL